MQFSANKFFASILLSFVLLFSSCKPSTQEVTMAAAGYSITLPSHMSASTELNEDALLQYQDSMKELYIIVIDESKEEFVQTFSEKEIYDEKLSVVNNYSTVQIESFRNSMRLLQEPALKKTKINGLDAEVVDFTGNVPDIDSDIFYKMAFIEGKEKLYMIMTWTVAADKNKNSDAMNKMIESFKLVK